MEISPDEELIEIYIQRPSAGEDDFETTIQKGARILERFPDSKWADDALFLIAKSFYYQQEYNPAIERFEELFEFSDNEALRQQAIVWKGRTLLHTNQYSEGISYLERILADYDSWDTEYRAEAGTVLAEHYARAEDFDESVSNLNRFLDELEDTDRKARGYFFYGQILERLERNREAFFAYEEVSSFYTDYQYEYWAELNRGKMARLSGNIDLAESIFQRMKNDNKNFERLDEIDFQIAMTEEANKDFQQAENSYRYILDNTLYSPSEKVEAKTYYQLAEIYNNQFDNYELASAYYDSSSSLRTRINTEANEEENVEDQASFFGNYADLRAEVARIDSLLSLSELDDQQLNTTLQQLRAQRIAELEEGGEENQSQENTLVNVESQQEDSSAESTIISGLGFLGHRDEDRVQQAKNAFRFQWGDRPLVDDWRRTEAIRSSSDRSGESPNVETDYTDEDLGIDRDEVPRSDDEKKELKEQKISVWYELGSLFFLNLNQPDSAEVYYKRVIDETSDKSLTARSKYALYELHNTNDRQEEAEKWRREILQNYPDSEFAARINEQDPPTPEADREELLNQFTEIWEAQDTTDSVEIAEKYRHLALKHNESELAPHIHYRAVEMYSRLAKSEADSSRYSLYWRNQFKEEESDTANITGDSLITEDLPITAFESNSPFVGAFWDSVRVLTDEYKQRFDHQPHETRIDTLQSVLGRAQTAKGKVYTCEELKLEPEISSGIDQFLEKVSYPRSLQNQQISGSIMYEVLIGPDGSLHSFKQLSDPTLPELEQVYEEAIEEHLVFEPISQLEEEERLRCTLVLPVEISG